MIYSYFNSAIGTTNELWLHKTEGQTIVQTQAYKNRTYLTYRAYKKTTVCLKIRSFFKTIYINTSYDSVYK